MLQSYTSRSCPRLCHLVNSSCLPSSPYRIDRHAVEVYIALEVVRYHQQDNLIQIYNGNTAVVTGYYTFTWKPKGEELKTQSGRASMVLVKQGGKWLTVHMHFSKVF